MDIRDLYIPVDVLHERMKIPLLREDGTPTELDLNLLDDEGKNWHIQNRPQLEYYLNHVKNFRESQQQKEMNKLRESCNIKEEDIANFLESNPGMTETDFFSMNGSLSQTVDPTIALQQEEFTPLMIGPFFRQTYLYDMLSAFSKTYWEKNHSPLAANIVRLTTEFVLGKGVGWHIENEDAKAYWGKWWKRNHLDKKLFTLSDDLTMNGENMLRYVNDPYDPSQLKVIIIDPATVWEIVTAPEDIEDVKFYHRQYPTQYQIFSQEIPSIKYIIDQIPACITGDTKIPLLDGTEYTIEELSKREKPYWVYSYDIESGKVVPGKAIKTWKTGIKRCVEVILDNGEIIKCSYDHPFLTRDGQYIWAENLQTGQSLMPLYRRISDKGLKGYELIYQPGKGNWTYTHQAISGRPVKGHVIHHKDFNKLNNSPDNLVKMDKIEHTVLHGRSQKGIKKTEGHLKKIREWQQSEAGKDYKIRMSNAAKERYTSPEFKNRWKKKNEERLNNLDYKEKISKILSDWQNQPEYKKKRSEKEKLFYSIPKNRQRLVRIAKTRWDKIDSKKQQSECLSSFYNSEEGKKKQSDKSNSYWALEKNRKKGSQISKERWSNPDFKIKRASTMEQANKDHSNRMAAKWADPEYKKKMYEARWGNQRLNHKVVCVKEIGELEVYDLTVEKYHNFAVAAGIFTHNTEMYHSRVNVAAGEKRGRSDYFPVLGWLKRFRDYYNAGTTKALMQASFVWKVSIKGDAADVADFTSNPENTRVPPPGSIWVANRDDTGTPVVDLEPMQATGTQSGDIKDLGMELGSIIAAAVGIPAEYLNQGGASSRASALVHTEPMTKKIQKRQLVFEQLLQDMYTRVMERAKAAGLIPSTQKRPANMQNLINMIKTGNYKRALMELQAVITQQQIEEPIDIKCEFIFPEVIVEDRSQKIDDILKGMQAGMISMERAANMFAKEMGISEFDFDSEMEKIGEEKKSGMTPSPVPGLYAKPEDKGGGEVPPAESIRAKIYKDTRR